MSFLTLPDLLTAATKCNEELTVTRAILKCKQSDSNEQLRYSENDIERICNELTLAMSNEFLANLLYLAMSKK